MKILNYSFSFLPHIGGIEQNIYYFSKYSKHKHSVLTNLLPHTSTFENIDGVDVYRMPPVTPPPFNSNLRMINHLLREIPREFNRSRFLKKIEYDILHLRGPYLANDIFYALDCFFGISYFKQFTPWSKSKKPKVVTFHLLLSSTKFLNKKDEDSFWIYNEKKSWQSYEIYLCKIADEIICVDHYMIEPLKKISNGKNIHFIPSGVDTSVFYPMEKEQASEKLSLEIKEKLSGKFNVLFVGRLDPMKGLNFIEELAKIISSDVQLIQIGAGKQKIESTKIIKLGSIQNDKIPFMLNSVDVLFQPLILEGISRVSLEGMACGKPVIMLGSHMDRYPLINDKNGFVVDRINEVKEKIEMLKNSHTKYLDISNNAIKTIKDYSVEKLAEKIDSVYQNCSK